MSPVVLRPQAPHFAPGPPRRALRRGRAAPAVAPDRCRGGAPGHAPAAARCVVPAAAPDRGQVRDQPAHGCEGQAAPREEDGLLGRAVAGGFRLRRRIGSGSFGSVYSARHDGSGLEVAVKMEPASAPYPQLSHEARVYEVLAEHRAVVPRVHWYGRDGDHHALVMDLLGPSLLDLHERCGGAFGLGTSIALAEQVVSRLEELHSAGLLHRDVKPDNFCMGHEASGAANKVYALDFGCAKRYRDPQTMRHIPEEHGKSMIGTARYASLRAHMGWQLSRRDDLECVGYLLVWFLKGRLPWQSLDASSTQERMSKIAAIKAGIGAATLCAGLPREIEAYVAYCRGLGFEERPDYSRLRSILRAAVGHGGVHRPLRLDWQPRPGDAEPRPADALTEGSALRQTCQLFCRSKVHQLAGAPAPRPGSHDAHALLLR